MPSWKGSLPDADIWAIAYYVRSVIEMKGTAAADALRAKLANQPAWTPPADPTPAPDAPAPAEKKG